jgi:heme/copper-type cytochrome/quinol oxidase subunit 4
VGRGALHLVWGGGGGRDALHLVCALHLCSQNSCHTDIYRLVGVGVYTVVIVLVIVLVYTETYSMAELSYQPA